MTDPTYHLEGVVRTRDEMTDFEGPLNLILMLLSKNKIEIRDIQISVITDQYLEQIAAMQESNLEVASEFVQMASHLLYIKTKMLLTGDDEEVSELEQLMSSLEQLQCREAFAALKTLVPELQKASEQGLRYHAKDAEPLPKSAGDYRYSHDPAELLQALISMFDRGAHAPEQEIVASRLVPKRIVFGVREKSRQLIDWLREAGNLSLMALFEKCESRSELVATFLSVLELCSMGSIILTADGEDDCTVSFSGGDTETILESISD